MLCQHSHCIGCYEEFEGCHILYGQGNFHFVKPPFVTGDLAKTWNNSLAVKYDTESHEIQFVPLVVEGSGIALAKGQEKEEILEAFRQRNAQLANGQWKEGWHAFCESMRGTYTGIIANAFTPESTEQQNAIFGHYLDCEAHTDVWRELFPTANMTNEK